MDPLSIARIVVTTGFAVWTTVVVINNLQGFQGAVASLGRTAAMSLLDDVPTPLRSRAVTNPKRHRLAMAILLALQIGVALLFWWSLAGFAFVGGEVGAGRAILAFAAFVAHWFAFLTGGLWFAYWIKQEGLQATHMVLLVAGMIGVLLMAA